VLFTNLRAAAAAAVVASRFIELPNGEIAQAVVMATMAARRVECGRGGGYGSDGDNCVIDLFTINTHTCARNPYTRQKLD